MPRYVYKCAICNDLFEVRHSLDDRKTDCERCDNKNSLIRIPAGFCTFEHTPEGPTKPGAIVESFIEDTKKEVKEEKEKLKQEEFSP